MTGEIEIAGEAVTAGMLARATEPAQGEARETGAAAAHCLNCTAPLSGSYCTQCGQAARIHRSFYAIWHDFLHSVLHFEGKFWRTLPELAIRPGRLTRRYINGERARFVSPFTMFIFSVFLMYAVSSITGDDGVTVQGQGVDKAATAAEKKEALDAASQAVAEMQAEFEASGLTPETQASVRAALNQAKQELQLASGVEGVTTIEDASEPKSRFDRTIAKLVKNPELFSYKIKNNAYKFSWVLILISVPLVWLLFPFRREFNLYDHCVFVTYSIAFMSLLFSLLMGIEQFKFATNLFTTALFVIVPLHMYCQMKDSYALSRSSTLLRLPLLYLFAGISASLFLTMLMVMV